MIFFGVFTGGLSWSMINVTSKNSLKKSTYCTYEHQHVLKVNIIGFKIEICKVSNVDHEQIVSSQAWLEVVPLLLSFQATTDQACCEVAPKIANLKMNQESNHGVCSSVGNLLENWSEE